MTSDLGDALRALERGGAIVIPTETVFGLCARLDRPEGASRLLEIKGRSRDTPFQILLRDVASIGRIADVSPLARSIAERFMPGSLTLVVRSIEAIPPVGGRPGTVGVRIPDHPTAEAVIEAAGPLVATSANRHKQPTPDTIEGVRDVFGAEVDAYLDGPPPPSGTASTVLDVTGAEPVVLREGAIPSVEILRFVGAR